MISVDKALKVMLNSVQPLKQSEKISILEARGRIFFNDVIAKINVPPFNNSAMDGYAVIAKDTQKKIPNKALKLKIIDVIQAGGSFKNKKITSGTAIKIMTGAPMPEGADAVIMIEHLIEKNGFIYPARSVKKKENVRLAGEDINKGTKIFKRGDVIKTADIGLLASLNFKEVTVFRKPKVAIISTGDELVDIDEKIRPGQIRNSNAYTLQDEIKKNQAIPYYLGIAQDKKKETVKKFREALKYDLIISSGGVSMGDYDFVKEAVKSLGIDLKIEKIKMKPGKPLAFGVKGNKIFFGLPGNPVSTMIAFIEFVRPVLLKLMGAEKHKKPIVKAILGDDLVKKPARLHFLRGVFSVKNGQFHVKVTGSQGSGILKSMSKANCFIILKEGLKFAKKGDLVPIQLINHENI
jgi:molybdopterin molybdotransferase